MMCQLNIVLKHLDQILQVISAHLLKRCVSTCTQMHDGCKIPLMSLLTSDRTGYIEKLKMATKRVEMQNYPSLINKKE